MTRHIVEAWRDWIAERIGDPFADVERFVDRLDAATAKEWIKEASATRDQLAAFSVGSPLAQRFMNNELGMAQLVYLLLQKHHPTITEDEAFDIMLSLGEKMPDVIQKTQGQPPPNGATPAAAAGRGASTGISSAAD